MYQIDDKIVMNVLANDLYTVTRQYWIGKVVIAREGSSTYGVVELDKSNVEFSMDVEYPHDFVFEVDGLAMDFYDEKAGVIKTKTLPKRVRGIGDIPTDYPSPSTAQEKEAERFASARNYGSANYQVYFPDTPKFRGYQTNDYDDMPCHGSLKGEGNTGAEFVFSVTTQSEHDENAEDFYKWLLQESPYAPVFITKDVDEALKCGVWLRTDVPSNYLLGACIASRYIWEKRYLLDVMYMLINKGLSHNNAFIMCHKFHTAHKDKNVLKITGSSPEEYAINANHIDTDLIKNFNLGKFHNPSTNYEQDSVYRGIFGLWSGDSGDVRDDYPELTMIEKEYPIEQDIDTVEKGWNTSVPVKGYSVKNVAEWALDIVAVELEDKKEVA